MSQALSSDAFANRNFYELFNSIKSNLLVACRWLFAVSAIQQIINKYIWKKIKTYEKHQRNHPIDV